MSLSNLSTIQAILVPQGAEYKAVCKGLNSITGKIPQVIAIPIGSPRLIKYLEKLDIIAELRKELQPKILVMGLCGSLKPEYNIGDIVIYQSCIYHNNSEKNLIREFERNLTTDLVNQLELHQKKQISKVKGITCDRIISSSAEKHHLAQTYDVDVVDMEGFTILGFFNSLGISVAMLRVVSDDSTHDLPDLNSAISSQGSLQTLPLALGMLRHPVAATRLIRGSLQGLKVLEQITTVAYT
ncbi:5'-methylthioadenosine/S-adenosylhomocysteine nucleosidase family protein [Brunnivagina elsteri]|uniref:Phosphorylase n=1 Tax=Brunnivagina elsteri CCALA 953 TaxID=987040 RepID=A0A2A2TMI1_9CYAN|nr:phosphorylase [Calothrix elsteri]PAX59756.1 phosphorylase [Calothrix elsteri CCALA 953]